MYDNPVLSEITGFNALQSVGYSFVINGNNALSEFCGLYNFFNYNNGVYHGTGTFDISGNLINPSIQDIIDGGPCAPLPVELTAFSGKVIENNVELSWQTATEVNNYGFEIQRASASTTPIWEWKKIGFAPGHGNSNSPKEYSLTDKNPNGGSKFIYRLKQIDSDGKFEYSDEVEVELVPNEFALYQNYPNPFNPSTVIKYTLPTASNVKLEVFNVTGEKVTTLVEGFKNEGYYEVNFNASGLPSGLYLYRISAGAFVQTRKMILLR